MLPPSSMEDVSVSPPAQISTVYRFNIQKTFVVPSIVVPAIVLLSGRTPTATMEQLAANISTIFERFTLFTWIGLYCSVAWLVVTTGQLWILDILGGRNDQVCGNKFLYCRPWD